MLTRRLGSRLLLYTVFALAILVLLASRLAFNTVQGDLSWKDSGVQSHNRVLVTGEFASWLTPLEDILTQRGIEKPRKISVEIVKSRRLLRLKVGGKTIKSYVIALGANPDLKKTRRGDSATPEGDYYVCEKLPRSTFYLSLKLSYPNADDARAGLKAGLIDKGTFRSIEKAIRRKNMPPMDTKLGGDICIHSGGPGKLNADNAPPFVDVCDWTEGCIAVRKNDVKELYDFIPLGTPVRVRP